VRAVAGGLRALGLRPEQRCAILSGTRLEWIVVDLGVLCAGGATTTIYPSSTEEECAYIVKDSASAFVFAENDEQVAKLARRRGELAGVRKVIVIDGGGGHDGWAIPLAELMARGREEDSRDPGAFARIAGEVGPDDLATLIYTSGTTGLPKGVELTHGNWVYEGEAIESLGLLRTEDVQYLWLPLSHSFGKVLEVAQLRIGFPTAVDGRVDKMVDNLAVIRPTFVAAVPRVFEKVHSKVVAGANESPLRRRIFDWALEVGGRISALRQQGKEPSPFLALRSWLATRLVFSKLQRRFGGRLRFFISGSAPLDRSLTEFFHAAGVLVLEGYGLTETSAATVVNRPDRYRLGTVGLPLEGTQIDIAHEDGEVLVRGRGVMRGYHNLPDATREALRSDGWLHTGDLGELLPGGFLRITGRKKDLIKTSGGKYVAPQALEGKLKASCPYVSQIVVHGNNRNFCTALVTVEKDTTFAWAAEKGVTAAGYEQLASHPLVRALIQGFVDELNATLPSYATIKRFAILASDLSQEAGDLTPSLKVKRQAVEQKYKSILDGLYEGAG
jgi:long-chain acyl-CoA synthetase